MSRGANILTQKEVVVEPAGLGLAGLFPTPAKTCFSSWMRVLVLAFVLFGVLACGGKEKPPLTPDQDNPVLDAGSEPAVPAK